MHELSVPSVVPAPRPEHLAVAASIENRLLYHAMELQGRYGVGLLVLTIDDAGGWQLSFTERRYADVPHVMSLGAPEEVAVTIVHRLGAYDPVEEALLAINDAHDRPGTGFSFVVLSLKDGLPGAHRIGRDNGTTH
jgi:hypothetical protein